MYGLSLLILAYSCARFQLTEAGILEAGRKFFAIQSPDFLKINDWLVDNTKLYNVFENMATARQYVKDNENNLGSMKAAWEELLNLDKIDSDANSRCNKESVKRLQTLASKIAYDFGKEPKRRIESIVNYYASLHSKLCIRKNYNNFKRLESEAEFLANVRLFDVLAQSVYRQYHEKCLNYDPSYEQILEIFRKTETLDDKTLAKAISDAIDHPALGPELDEKSGRKTLKRESFESLVQGLTNRCDSYIKLAAEPMDLIVFDAIATHEDPLDHMGFPNMTEAFRALGFCRGFLQRYPRRLVAALMQNRLKQQPV